MLPSIWPAKSEPKQLLCTRVQCSADQLFYTMLVSSDLQRAVHKSRDDLHYTVWPWSTSQAELPSEQYTWQAPAIPAGPHTAQHRYRKTRFESAPSALATKPFQNEDLQVLVDYVEGQRYVMEARAITSAPYGDKFELFLRTRIASETRSTCCMQIQFMVQWHSSMNRLMRPIVQKAIEGGVSSSIQVMRGILSRIHKVEDVKESDVNTFGVELPPVKVSESSVPPPPVRQVPSTTFISSAAPSPMPALPPARQHRQSAPPDHDAAPTASTSAAAAAAVGAAAAAATAASNMQPFGSIQRTTPTRDERGSPSPMSNGEAARREAAPPPRYEPPPPPPVASTPGEPSPGAPSPSTIRDELRASVLHLAAERDYWRERASRAENESSRLSDAAVKSNRERINWQQTVSELQATNDSLSATVHASAPAVNAATEDELLHDYVATKIRLAEQDQLIAELQRASARSVAMRKQTHVAA